MNLDSVFQRNEQVLVQEVEGEAVLVLPAAGKVRVLNETGAFIWHHLDGKKRLADVVQALCAAYNVRPEEAGQDVLAFVTDLLERDLVSVVS